MFRKLLPLLLSCAALGFTQDHNTELFESEIRPLLANKCYSCHTASKLGDL